MRTEIVPDPGLRRGVCHRDGCEDHLSMDDCQGHLRCCRLPGCLSCLRLVSLPCCQLPECLSCLRLVSLPCFWLTGCLNRLKTRTDRHPSGRSIPQCNGSLWRQYAPHPPLQPDGAVPPETGG